MDGRRRRANGWRRKQFEEAQDKKRRDDGAGSTAPAAGQRKAKKSRREGDVASAPWFAEFYSIVAIVHTTFMHGANSSEEKQFLVPDERNVYRHRARGARSWGTRSRRFSSWFLLTAR
jgi:hypothetical protein